jgi:hypothetical protein
MHTSSASWTTGLILKHLETTHGQWLYWNVQFHDAVDGTHAILRKEQLQQEIKLQLELGATGLLQKDKYLMEINLEGLETTSGEHQEYWLLVVNTGRKAKLLQEQQQLAHNSQQDCEQMGNIS